VISIDVEKGEKVPRFDRPGRNVYESTMPKKTPRQEHRRIYIPIEDDGNEDTHLPCQLPRHILVQYRVEQGLIGHPLLECFGFELLEVAFEYFDIDRFSFGIFVTHGGFDPVNF